jgi:hypothetical protein
MLESAEASPSGGNATFDPREGERAKGGDGASPLHARDKWMRQMGKAAKDSFEKP